MIGDDSRFFVSGDFNMQGRVNYVLYKSVEYSSIGNFELGAKAGYSFGKYEIALFARNLTNEQNLIGVRQGDHSHRCQRAADIACHRQPERFQPV